MDKNMVCKTVDNWSTWMDVGRGVGASETSGKPQTPRSRAQPTAALHLLPPNYLRTSYKST